VALGLMLCGGSKEFPGRSICLGEKALSGPPVQLILRCRKLLADFAQLDSRSVGVEFVGTSITSKGDGTERAALAAALRAQNPFIKHFNDERGYVRCEVTPQTWRGRFFSVFLACP
jgi:hypothetical protein